MTVEVVERGVAPQDKQYEVRCVHCKSKLRFKRSDARAELDRNETYLAIACPVCGSDVTANL